MNDGQTPVPDDGFLAAGSPNPCLNCGACCAAFRVSFYWSESDQAVAGSVPAEMTCQIAPLLCAMSGTDQPHPRCIALQGNVGMSVWCAIYARRPSVCYEVVPSGPDGTVNAWCDRARATWGLPPLWLAPVFGPD
jgi:Fe-S-cluster containining protein